MSTITSNLSSWPSIIEIAKKKSRNEINRYGLILLLRFAGTGRSQTSALIKADQYSHSHSGLNHAIALCMIGNMKGWLHSFHYMIPLESPSLAFLPFAPHQPNII